MEKKQTTLVLSFALMACFFVPIFQWDSFEMSGINYLLSSHIPAYKYFLLLIPVSSLFLFLGMLNDVKDFPGARLLSIIPFLTLLLVYVVKYLNRASEGYSTENGNIFSGTYPTFWVMLGFSLFLLIVHQRKAKVSEA